MSGVESWYSIKKAFLISYSRPFVVLAFTAITAYFPTVSFSRWCTGSYEDLPVSIYQCYWCPQIDYYAKSRHLHYRNGKFVRYRDFKNSDTGKCFNAQLVRHLHVNTIIRKNSFWIISNNFFYCSLWLVVILSFLSDIFWMSTSHKAPSKGLHRSQGENYFQSIWSEICHSE